VPIVFSEYRGRETRDVAAFNPDLLYNGRPLLSQPMTYRRTKHTTHHEFTQDRAELHAFFDGFVQEGSIPATVVKLDEAAHGPGVAVPDFDVTLTHGDRMYVEVTTGGERDTIGQDRTTWDMSAALAEWSVNDAQAQARLAGIQIGFTPQRPFLGKDERAAFEELRAFIQDEDYEPYRGSFGEKVASPRYPLLTQAQVIVSIAEARYSVATIHVPAGSFSPSSEADTVLMVINAKKDKGYPLFRPIRLVVGIVHVIGYAEDTFDTVRGSLTDLGPFDRIYVANSAKALVAQRR
jgi:hypothetical protein